MSAPENPAAFPRTLDADEVQFDKAQVGMSLRDWFAGQALPQAYDTALSSTEGSAEHIVKIASVTAYMIADAMLAARSRNGRA